MYKILILDGVDKKAVEILENDFQVDIKPSMTPEQLKEIISEYDALIVRSQTKVNKEAIDASNLKIIGRAGVGVDNIDVDAATRKGVIVVNSPDGNTVAAAEQTIALLMSVARYIPDANKSLKNGEWKRKEGPRRPRSGARLPHLHAHRPHGAASGRCARAHEGHRHRGRHRAGRRGRSHRGHPEARRY